MSTNGEKAWMKETGGDLTPEQARRRLTHAALDNAITLASNLLDALREVEFESGNREDFDRILHSVHTPRGWLTSLHNYLLLVQQKYEEE